LTAPELAQPISLSLDPARARRQIEALLHTDGWTGDVDEVVLALHEALVNAQRHAGGALRAEACVDRTGLVIRIWDRGQGFDPTPYVRRAPDPMAERGRGLWLISRIATSCEVRHGPDGVGLLMRFDRP
jgi:anti-sigma regulatory factor (Ser/Thr protein kinase)